MNLLPCPTKVTCPGDNPLSNYSSEAPDPPIRLGYSTGTSPTSSFRLPGGAGPPTDGFDPPPAGQADTGTGGDPPPLDSEFDNPIVTTNVEVTDPDLDPNSVAGNDNVTALSEPGPDGGGYRTRPRLDPVSVYINHPQTCSVECPDGQPFTFTVPLGRFRSFSQADADRAAYSYACKMAALNVICMGSIATSACVAVQYDQTITASTIHGPVVFSLLSGSIPAWLTATAGPFTLHLVGTPDTGDIADVTFTLKATDARGSIMVKTFAISVTECGEPCIITESTLAAFDQGQPYSAQLHATGGTAPYSWALVEGSLPLGLSLSTSGLISGTATLVNGNLDAIFTVEAIDSSHPAVTCTKAITLPVLNYNNFPPGKHWRIKNYAGLDSSCCQVCGLCNVWDGSFITQFAAATFRGDLSAGINNHLTTMFLQRAFSGEWAIHLYCTTIPGNATWAGIKIGSNAGAKLDSPAGVYTLNNWFGDITTCDSTATLTIEEY